MLIRKNGQATKNVLESTNLFDIKIKNPNILYSLNITNKFSFLIKKLLKYKVDKNN